MWSQSPESVIYDTALAVSDIQSLLAHCLRFHCIQLHFAAAQIAQILAAALWWTNFIYRSVAQNIFLLWNSV